MKVRFVQLICPIIFLSLLSFLFLGEPATAIGVANIVLPGEIEQRSRDASATLLRALGDFNNALVNMEIKDTSSYQEQVKSSIELLSKASVEMREIGKDFEKEIREAPFTVPSDQQPVFIAWLNRVGGKDAKDGYDVFLVYVSYVDSTQKFLIENGQKAEMSRAEIETLVFGMGSRIGDLYQIGALISQGFKSEK